MFEGSTATELAAAFDKVQTLDLNFTGPLSVLDEAVERWTTVYPELVESHRVFANTYRTSMRSTRPTQASIATLRQAAAQLAKQLHRLGNVRLNLCKEKTPWGTCNTALTGDVCIYSHNHSS